MPRRYYIHCKNTFYLIMSFSIPEKTFFEKLENAGRASWQFNCFLSYFMWEFEILGYCEAPNSNSHGFPHKNVEYFIIEAVLVLLYVFQMSTTFFIFHYQTSSLLNLLYVFLSTSNWNHFWSTILAMLNWCTI